MLERDVTCFDIVQVEVLKIAAKGTFVRGDTHGKSAARTTVFEKRRLLYTSMIVDVSGHCKTCI